MAAKRWRWITCRLGPRILGNWSCNLSRRHRQPGSDQSEMLLHLRRADLNFIPWAYRLMSIPLVVLSTRRRASSEALAFFSFHRCASRKIERRTEARMTTLTERMNHLAPTRRKKVEERTKVLIAEEMCLRDLRRVRKQTQVRVAKELGINQENVSRIERRSDLLLSTLSGYVRAMGGKLSLVAEFPDHPPITLTGIAALGEDNPPLKS